MSQVPYSNQSGPTGQISLNVISEGINIVKKDVAMWMVSALVLIVLGYVVSFAVQLPVNVLLVAMDGLFERIPVVGGVSLALLTVMSAIIAGGFSQCVYAGFYQMGFKAIRNEPVTFSDMFGHKDKILQIFIAQLIIAVGTIIGFILCIIPGIIFSIATYMTVPLIVERNMPAVEAIKLSIETVKSNFFSFLGAMIVIGLFAGIGALLCGVGMLFTLPAAMIAICAIYRDTIGLSQMGRPMGDLAYGVMPDEPKGE